MAGSVGGAFTGLYQGGGGAADASAALKPLLPNISVYQQGASTAPQLQAQVTAPAQSYSSGGALSQFGHFLGGLAMQTGHLVEGAGSWLAHNAVNMAEAPGKLGTGLGNSILDKMSINTLSSQTAQASAQQAQLSSDFKAGKITAKQYQLGMKSLIQTYNDLEKQQVGISAKVTMDQKSSQQALIDTASGLVTILTAGFGSADSVLIKAGANAGLEPAAAQSAADWFASKLAAPILEPASATISRLASDSRVFSALDSATQNVLQRSTAEVVSQAGVNMTSSQIARATAVNVALKYPIYFNYLSGTAHQVYNELDQQKYGDAIRTLAFNGALLLSGGPIEQALKYGGQALKGLNLRTFGSANFWDEMGKLHGTTDAYVKAISDAASKMAPADAQQFIKDLSAVAAFNTHAMQGDAALGAARVFNGMKTAYGIDMRQGDPAQQIQDMVGLAKNMRLAQSTADKLGLGNVVVGRFDVRSKSAISDAITQTEDKSAQFQAWSDFKNTNPNEPFAVNASLDKQVTDLIANSTSTAELKQGIMDIKALTTVEGFPKTVLEKMAADGYIPIKPRGLEAPFKEGDGVLKTSVKFPGRNGGATPDFFTQAVQPLPVLTSVGSFFTHLGLSPNASTQKAYEYFNDNVAKSLASSGVIKSMINEDLRQTSDIFIKQLSNFAHDAKLPTPDLRMLTRKQIVAATGVTHEEAALVQKAISRAWVDVPLTVRGMGDKAVDWSYNLPAGSSVTRQYLKIQGALRFAFNPFFQYLRVIPKTEMLSEASGGGVLSSIFMGRAGAINDIRAGLKSGGFLETGGHFGNVTSGEAVDFAGSMSGNISKRLLPMQERSIAGLVDAQANRLGMSWQDFIHQYPQETADTIQRIAGYDRNSNFLNSPLARTLNIVAFPFRFDAKVAIIFSQALAKTAPLTQVAVINGILKAHDFLNSPEGQTWYSQNSTAIKIFSYITPIASMADVVSSLVPGHDHSLGNFGELGGLPFGWIPQILDSEGLTHFNLTGVDAKTGNAIPTYIPATMKGQAAIAIQDLLGSLFSYPGASIGLPSKTAITRSAGLGLVGATKAKDLTKTTPQLSQEQLTYQQNIQHFAGTAPPPPPNYQSQPTGNQFVSPSSTHEDLTATLKANAKAKKLKKGDFVPPPAPGQSAVGVL